SWLIRSAENIGDPHAGRILAELAEKLTPRPGPSKARRASKAALGRRVRNVWRTHYKSLSASAAAHEMAGSVVRYSLSAGYKGGVEPVMAPNATWHAVLTTEPKAPSVRTFQRWLAKN